MIESELLQEKYRVQKKLTEECKTVDTVAKVAKALGFKLTVQPMV